MVMYKKKLMCRKLLTYQLYNTCVKFIEDSLFFMNIEDSSCDIDKHDMT